MSEMKTRDSIQLSYGRYLDWKTQNPILLPGELACVLDDGSLQPIAIRFGNGLKAFNDLPSLPLVDTGDKYLSDEHALVYTQEEVDEIKQALEGQIKTVDESLAALKNSTETLDSSLSEKMDEAERNRECYYCTFWQSLVMLRECRWRSVCYGRRPWKLAEVLSGSTSRA